MAGMATALRLQAEGLDTVVFEAHGHAGGCAGYWRHRGFSFDVGATTLVDFEPGGVGEQWLRSVDAPAVRGEHLPGYTAWLPDRVVTLHRDAGLWHDERLRAFGDTARHRAFWARARPPGARLLEGQPGRDPAAAPATRGRRPCPDGPGTQERTARPTNPHDARQRPRAARPRSRPGTAGVAGHARRGHRAQHGGASPADQRGARRHHPRRRPHSARGRDAWLLALRRGSLPPARRPVAHGGRGRGGGGWRRAISCSAHAAAGRTRSRVVLAVPASAAFRMCSGSAARARLRRYLDRDRDDLGGAVVVFLGVPEQQVSGQSFTHHQLLHDYAKPLGDGNNMFVSVSAAGDTLSAPSGHRAVMLSTHTELAAWSDLDAQGYEQRKKEASEQLIGLARRVYPELGERAVVEAVGTPRAYERFGFRPGGAVGGVRQSPSNSNQSAIPHDLGGPGLWLVGDSTWPGLGTVACVIGSRHRGRGDPARIQKGTAMTTLPTLRELGNDLLATTTRQRVVALARPGLGIGSLRRGRGRAPVVADAADHLLRLRLGGDGDPRRRPPHARADGAPPRIAGCSCSGSCCWRAGTLTG